MPSNLFSNYFYRQRQLPQHQQNDINTSILEPTTVGTVDANPNPVISNLINQERPKHNYHKSSDNLAIGL